MIEIRKKGPLHLVIQICYGFLKKIEIVSLLMYTLTPSLPSIESSFFWKEERPLVSEATSHNEPHDLQKWEGVWYPNPSKTLLRSALFTTTTPFWKIDHQIGFCFDPFFFIYPEKNIYTKSKKKVYPKDWLL